MTGTNFKIYVQEGWCFVDLGNNYLLCFASKEDFDKADAERICEMVREAVAINLYRGLTTEGVTLH